MEAALMGADIDGDVLLYLEMAQVWHRVPPGELMCKQQTGCSRQPYSHGQLLGNRGLISQAWEMGALTHRRTCAQACPKAL